MEKFDWIECAAKILCSVNKRKFIEIYSMLLKFSAKKKQNLIKMLNQQHQ